MERLRKTASKKIYHDDPIETYVVLARGYSFWMLHEGYEENKEFLEEIKVERDRYDEAIKKRSEEEKKKIEEMISMYKWKDNNYGSGPIKKLYKVERFNM